MTAGRPTKYTPEFIEAAKAYVAGEYTFEGAVIPSIEGLAVYAKVGRSTLHEWANDEEKHEFLDIYEEIQSRQASMVINNALKGDYNAAIAKLLLGKHGYSERSEVDNTSRIVVIPDRE